MEEAYREGIIISNIRIATNVYELRLGGGFGFHGEPGQFYMLRGWKAMDPFLSRPISICNIIDGEIIFLYEVVGKGTRIISELKPGDILEALGPLGNGFDTRIKGQVALISGGAGIAPMVCLANEIKSKTDVYCGFNDEVYYLDEIKEFADNVFVSTEDGSYGHRGFITDIFKPENYDIVFACGPLPMMREVLRICKGVVPIYVSMDSRMACGIGACLGCAIKTTQGMKRVCKDGPVFSGEEVILND